MKTKNIKIKGEVEKTKTYSTLIDDTFRKGMMDRPDSSGKREKKRDRQTSMRRNPPKATRIDRFEYWVDSAEYKRANNHRRPAGR